MTLTHNEIEKINVEQFRNFLKQLEFKELIQFLLLENKKGENSLLFKTILDNHTVKEEAFVKDEIEVFNKNAGNMEQWGESSDEIYMYMNKQYYEKFEGSINKGCGMDSFLLFTLNYVFASYTNRRFRRHIGVKKRKWLSKY